MTVFARHLHAARRGVASGLAAGWGKGNVDSAAPAIYALNKTAQEAKINVMLPSLASLVASRATTGDDGGRARRRRPLRVLDVGCGDGSATRYVLDRLAAGPDGARFGRVVGCDLSAAMVAHAAGAGEDGGGTPGGIQRPRCWVGERQC